MSEAKYISIKGANVNNLKNVSVDIPRNKLVVITGLSGSGKSSLAFDTLYAEGQRRYVESLNSYVRQYLSRYLAPSCESMTGIAPSLAIGQQGFRGNIRSTVGTSSEIYPSLCKLYALIGRTYSMITGEEVKSHTIEDVVDEMSNQPEGERMVIMSPIRVEEGTTLTSQLSVKLQKGFVRIEVNGKTVRIEEYTPQAGDVVFLLVDRMVCSYDKDTISRFTESATTAFQEGEGTCMVRYYHSDGTTSLYTYRTRMEADGICYEKPTAELFSFNSGMGACATCGGTGSVLGVDRQLVIPDSSLSVYDGAVVCWRGEKMGAWRDEVIKGAAAEGFPVFTPYHELTQVQKDMLWKGTKSFGGINDFFKMVEENRYKIQYRVMMARYRGKTTCPDCGGSRLRKEALCIRILGKNIADLANLTLDELDEFFSSLTLNETEKLMTKRLMEDIKKRISVMKQVGLGYLSLNRPANTLSGGESQRLRLAGQLVNGLVGSIYVLDEPSIGLHSRDTDQLITVLKHLRDEGNTVVVVEHDEDIIRAADYLIDMGPEAGRCGGEVIFHGPLTDLKPGSRSYTARYLLGEDLIPVPATRRPWNKWIELIGVREHNLKGINVKFPLNVMTVVTGVSGSGKSTLVDEVLYRALKRAQDEPVDRPGEFKSLEGDWKSICHVEYIDQHPIGKSTRSNPVTYLKVYDDIRKLYAEQPLSKQMGYTAGHFSFNSEGGRCEECKGAGTVTIEMQFMADRVLECESCHGKRFKSDILEVQYGGLNIYDVLELTVEQAVEFFQKHGQHKIVKRLMPLVEVGLDYIKLGQSSSTLSGGENQRVKLAYFLSQEKVEPTLFIFDEPTTGLHIHDIHKLLHAFDALIRRGHSVLIIEHNLEIIKCADYVIDIGPEGGDKGGQVVVCGTPEEVAACQESYTGYYLKEKLVTN